MSEKEQNLEIGKKNPCFIEKYMHNRIFIFNSYICTNKKTMLRTHAVWVQLCWIFSVAFLDGET